MLRARICILLLCVTCLASIELFAQRDLIPPSDPVYKFLLRQETNGTLNGFHWGMLPLSRTEVADFLDSLENARGLSTTDRNLFTRMPIHLPLSSSTDSARIAIGREKATHQDRTSPPWGRSGSESVAHCSIAWGSISRRPTVICSADHASSH